MKKVMVRFAVVIMLATVVMFAFTGCNMETHQMNDQYVSSVKEMVNDSVTYTRKLRQQDEGFDCHDNEKIRGYLLVTDDLINTFEKIQTLKSTDEFDEMDIELKRVSKQALTMISQLKQMVVYAQQSGSDAIYQREKNGYFDQYYSYYEDLRSISSEIQTYWRNA